MTPPDHPSQAAVEAANRLRQEHRAKRAALSQATLAQHASALQQQVQSLPAFQRANHLAGYIAIRGEIDVAPLLHSAHEAGKCVYLPALRGERMLFLPYLPGSALKTVGMGLQEPDSDDSNAIDPEKLDLVLTPLVTFDASGNRIGQGGGYYDRTFAFSREPNKTTPFLLGVAHDSQREPALSPMPWDVSLNAIATDTTLYCRADPTP